MGVSTAVIVVAFLSIWGAVHGRGPFAKEEPFSSVLSLQLFLIFAATPFMVLAALVEERKRGQEELQDSEERLRLAVKAGRMYAFEWDTATDVIVRSGECADIFNWMEDPTRDTGRQFAARVHPDDRQAYMTNDTRLAVENPTYQITFRIVRPDGSVVWLEDSGHGFFDSQGRLLRTIGMVADVTERKLAEEALSSVSRRLIEAQEQERSRIARELHDDLSQRMALIQIGLEQLAQDSVGLSFKHRQQLYDLAKVSTEVSSSIHNLSHQLHPYKLDTLGLVASLRGFFGEFARQHNLRVQFVHHDIRSQIPNEVTLCLFRIVQEALRNVVKHSGASQAKVELSGHADRIDLRISDSGAGFAPGNGKAATGLGLISMGERLRHVKGHLSIESQPSRGTRIRASVPVSATNCLSQEPRANGPMVERFTPGQRFWSGPGLQTAPNETTVPVDAKAAMGSSR
jgi:PAS domain S-box-containing protein